MKTGLIVGTGMDRLAQPDEWQDVPTPYGNTHAADVVIRGKRVMLIRRHGPGLNVPPHLVNYKANMWAMKDAGVTNVLCTAAVGSLRADLEPGALAVVKDFIDFTKGRTHTIYDHPAEKVVHTDFSEPYCPTLSALMEDAASDAGIALARRVVYLCVDGPRYETPAEIRMFAQWGGDVIGMTSVPEAVLARELGMCYSCLSVVTNFAAGISPTPISHQEVVAMMAERSEQISAVIERTIGMIHDS